MYIYMIRMCCMQLYAIKLCNRDNKKKKKKRKYDIHFICIFSDVLNYNNAPVNPVLRSRRHVNFRPNRSLDLPWKFT